MSGGEKRRVAIAGVLATEPQILVLDEPTAGLDPAAGAEFDTLLERLRQGGVTLLLVTHDLDRAAARCDRILVFHEGRVALDEPPASAFIDRERLVDLGLAVPGGVRLADRLREAGCSIPNKAVTEGDIVLALTFSRPSDT